jgi:hypothetical protein
VSIRIEEVNNINMEDVVNNEAEVLQPDSPSTSEEQAAPVEDTDTTSDQSGEDINTPGDEGDEESTEDQEQVSEGASNRFQELANENKQLKEEINQRRLREEQSEQMSKAEASMLQTAQQLDPNSAQGLQAQLYALQLANERREIDSQWQQVEKDFPQIKEDRDLENLVFENFLAARQLNPNARISDSAKKLVGYLDHSSKKGQKKAIKQAEKALTEKVSSSGSTIGASNTNTQADSASRARQQAIQRYRETGDPRHLDTVLV